MPLYEYRCDNCGHELTQLQKLSDKPLVACPHCHQDSLKKLISASAFKLEGTGWYETDFKGKKPAESSASETKTIDAAPAA